MADFSQQDYPVEQVLKNPDPRHHGWAVSPKLTEPHTAVFATDVAVDLPPGTELTLTLDHQFEYSYPGFSIGKFRVSVTGDKEPALTTVPQNVLNILKRRAAERTAKEKGRSPCLFRRERRADQAAAR